MVLHNHGLHASYKFDVIEVRSYVASSFVYILCIVTVVLSLPLCKRGWLVSKSDHATVDSVLH